MDHHKRGSFILPTQRTLAFFLGLFDDYIESRKIGVTIISDCNSAVGMWGTLTVDGSSPFDLEYSHIAHGHGVYVMPEARRKGLYTGLWQRAERLLRKRGIDAVIGASITENSHLRPAGIRRGFKTMQSTEIKAL